tara:strand:+ start:1561 stop:2238 length:678 start_codon:yes stop_codon:yes gene_type:complete
MAQSGINIGQLANDGTGDDLREAFIKVNNNFTELYARSPESTTAINLVADDATTAGLFAQKSSQELQFKSLKAGPNVSLSTSNNQITITSSGIVSILFTTDAGSVGPINASGVARFLGTGGVATTGSGTDVTIDSKLERETSPKLTTTLNLNNQNLTNGGTITATNFDGLVRGKNVSDIDSIVGFDFGSIDGKISNILQWLEADNEVNLGTINTPASKEVDIGSI